MHEFRLEMGRKAFIARHVDRVWSCVWGKGVSFITKAPSVGGSDRLSPFEGRGAPVKPLIQRNCSHFWFRMLEWLETNFLKGSFYMGQL